MTEFVKHLGSRSDCVIEDTPKGWFVLYNPVDAEDALRRQLDDRKNRESAADRGIEKVLSNYL